MMASDHVFVYLNGGLGNQLFQFAMAHGIAGESRKVVLIDNAGEPRRNASGELEISYAIGKRHFQTVSIESQKKLLSRICNLLLMAGIAAEKSVTLDKLVDFASMIASLPLSLIIGCKIQVVVCRGHGSYKTRVSHTKGNLLMIGYFQSRENVLSGREKILHALEINHGKKIDNITTSDNIKRRSPLAIHVRRGDYLLESKIGCLSDEYFLEAFNNAQLLGNYNEVWIFTEDNAEISELKEKIKETPIRVFTRFEYDAPTTLLLMSKCHGLILSNSTFSWWSGFLSSDLSSQSIFFPTPWFKELDEPKGLFNGNGIGIGSKWLN